MAKRRRRGLVLLALATALLATAAWQKDNIDALLLHASCPEETLAQRREEGDRVVEQTVGAAVESVGGTPIGVLTEEERAQLRTGTLSEEEALALVLGEPAAPAEPQPAGGDTEQSAPAPGAPAQGAPAQSAPEPVTPAPDPAAEAAQAEQAARVRTLVAEVYVMRDSYVAKLEQIRLDALEEYTALPAKKRTKTAKARLAADCIDRATALEKECDGRIEAIYQELRTLLRACGGDASLAEQMKAAYAEEKAFRKAEYLSEYLQ